MSGVNRALLVLLRVSLHEFKLRRFRATLKIVYRQMHPMTKGCLIMSRYPIDACNDNGEQGKSMSLMLQQLRYHVVALIRNPFFLRQQIQILITSPHFFFLGGGLISISISTSITNYLCAMNTVLSRFTIIINEIHQNSTVGNNQCDLSKNEPYNSQIKFPP